MPEVKLEVAFIGSGNMAWHLAQAIDRAGHTVAQVISRTEESAKELAVKFGAHYSSDISKVYGNVDVCFLCVPDDQLVPVVRSLPPMKSILVHTCGPESMDILASKSSRFGVFYPLQSLTKGEKQNMLQVPILLEASGNETYALMYALADSISNKVLDVSGEDRLRYHLAAVLVNNFSNHLGDKAAQFLKESNLDFSVLHPIIMETARKMVAIGPERSQTGPAKRGDAKTMDKHLDLLKNKPELSAWYTDFSESIRKRFKS